jgi:Tfp pilus assembly protein PilX
MDTILVNDEFRIPNDECLNANAQHSSFVIRHSTFRSTPCRSRGVALLLCLFILSVVSMWLVHMLDSQTVYQSALRNTIEYEQALYLANAGVHHAVAELEGDTSWRGTATAGNYPAAGTYSATAVNGAAAGTVDITAYGVAGGVMRKLSATVQVE